MLLLEPETPTRAILEDIQRGGSRGPESQVCPVGYLGLQGYKGKGLQDCHLPHPGRVDRNQNTVHGVPGGDAGH